MNLEKALDNSVFSVVSEVASELEQSTYVIGGFVRDYLLQRGSKKDIDIVTEGSGIDLAKKTANKIDSRIKVSEAKISWLLN